MSTIRFFVLTIASALFGLTPVSAETIRMSCGNWPGFVAWEVALQKGFFAAEGLEVELVWSNYSESMDAFSRGSLDALCITNGDALVLNSSGVRLSMILATDYSNGNDMIVARRGISSVKDLVGKRVGVEIGLVDHLLLLKALELNGVKESSVRLIHLATESTTKALIEGSVDAIAAWQPDTGTALRGTPGSSIVFTSAEVPGLIFDALAVNPARLKSNPATWQKMTRVWYRTVDFILNAKTKKEAVSIMAKRSGISDAAFLALLDGTRLLTAAEAKKVFQDSNSLESIYGSSRVADAFNIKNGIYLAPQKLEAVIDPTFVRQLK